MTETYRRGSPGAPRPPRGSLATTRLVLCLAVIGCRAQSGYDQADASPWMLHETIEVTGCAFRLDESFLRHEEHWRAGLGITTTNIGDSSTRCAWDMVIIDQNGDVISSQGRAGGDLGLESERDDYVEVDQRFTVEADVHGSGEGIWIHVRLHAGYVPSAGEPYRIVGP